MVLLEQRDHERGLAAGTDHEHDRALGVDVEEAREVGDPGRPEDDEAAEPARLELRTNAFDPARMLPRLDAQSRRLGGCRHPGEPTTASFRRPRAFADGCHRPRRTQRRSSGARNAGSPNPPPPPVSHRITSPFLSITRAPFSSRRSSDGPG